MAEHEQPRSETAQRYPMQPSKMINDESPKHAPRRGLLSHKNYNVKSNRRSIYAFTAIFLVSASFTVLTVWLIYRPHEPKFTVVNLTIYQLNTTYTPSPSVSAKMQFNLLTRNPNRRVSIFYDQLSAYIYYKDRPITGRVDLPPLYHETKSTVALSPVLEGSDVPVVNEVVNGLILDESIYGVVGLSLVMVGKLRYKMGAFTSGPDGVYVRCDLYVGLKQGFVGLGPAPLLGESGHCRVDV